jgi:hypothetical protein
MKYFSYTIKIGVLAVLGLGLGSCEDYLDINTDPNNPTVAPLSGLLANASFETGNNVQDLGGITSFYVQYLASPNEASSTDIHDEVAYDTEWFNLYNVMTDLSDLEVQSEEAGATDYLGVAKILKALNLAMTLDVWGDIPYEDAFFAQTLNPTYDDDQALYDEVLQLLDNGITELQKGGSTFEIGNDDFIFGGDTDRWLKFAHALKARYLLHLSETSDYDPQAVLAEIDQGLTSSEDDAQVAYFEAENNPWFIVADNNANLLLGGWISEQLVEALDGTTYGYVDPRQIYLYDTTDAGEFIGTPNGAGRGDAPEQGARSTLVEGTFYTNPTSPVLILPYFEQKFIEAEAALDASDQNRAYEAYLAGIRAHMEKIGVEEAEIEAYLSTPAVAVGAPNLTEELIYKEKYIAMFLHPETWVDARRYDYQYEDMTLPANHNPELNGQFIRRLIYPDSETTRNGQNVPDVTLSDNLWWDQ